MGRDHYEGDNIVMKREDDCRVMRKRIRENIEAAAGRRRRRRIPWDRIPHQILVKILEKLPWTEWPNVGFVSRSWQLALLDVLFPPHNKVLDLRVLDSIELPYPRIRRRFIAYLRIALHRRPPSAWKKLYMPNNRSFNQHFLTGIAERTSLLHYLNVPNKTWDPLNYCPVRLLPYWKNLRAVHVSSAHVGALQTHCKFICELSLYGEIDDTIALRVAKGFPHLKQLVISSCIMSHNALKTILDTHKNLLLLDTQHCYCVDQDVIKEKRYFPPPKAVWEEEVINEKAAGVKLHLQCARQHCSQCAHLYIETEQILTNKKKTEQ